MRALSGIESTGRRASEAPGLRDSEAALLACSFASLPAVVLYAAARSPIDTGSYAAIGIFTASLFALSAVFSIGKRSEAFSLLTLGLAVACFCATLAMTTALMGLRHAFPLVDRHLLSLDAALFPGVAAAIVRGCGRVDLLPALHIVYQHSVDLIFLVIIASSLSRDRRAVWKVCFTFSACASACASLSALMPAAGAFVGAGVDAGLLERLPPNAGVFHLPVFNAYRADPLLPVSAANFCGVVTFPSFHACMGAILAAASGRGRLRAVGVPCGLLVVVSAIPIGGHYVVDVVAGLALAWASSAAFDALWDGRRRPASARVDAPPAARGAAPHGGHAVEAGTALATDPG